VTTMLKAESLEDGKVIAVEISYYCYYNM
jgi:hypothetical protein